MNELNDVHTMLISFGVYCQQGYQGRTNSVSARCLIFCSYISGILAFNFYTSVLVSTIVDSKYESNMKTAADFGESNYSLEIQNESLARYWIQVICIFFNKSI